MSQITADGTLFYTDDGKDLNVLKCLIVVKICRLESKIKKEVVTNREHFRFESGSSIIRHPSSVAYLLSNDSFSCRTSLDKMSKVIQWISFSKHEIHPFLQGALLQPGLTRDGRFQNKLRINRLNQSLDVLNDALKADQFLLGNEFTLADLEIAVDLIPAFHSSPPLIGKQHVNLQKWFDDVTRMEGFKEICDVTKLNNGNGNSTKRVKAKNLPVVEPNPLKILCLHGYRQNEVMYRDKLGAFRKMIGKSAEFKFITAPHKVPPLEDSDKSENGNLEQKGWWFSREDDFFRASFVSDCDKGFKESLDLILETWKTFGPFDGVLGFSQGAAMAALLCSMQTKEPSFPTNFRFAILFSGFISQSSKHSKWYSYTDRIKVPSLHVYGLEDKVIGDMSSDLVPYFENPTVVEHPGGHFIPATSKQKEPYMNFIRAFMRNETLE